MSDDELAKLVTTMRACCSQTMASAKVAHDFSEAVITFEAALASRSPMSTKITEQDLAALEVQHALRLMPDDED